MGGFFLDSLVSSIVKKVRASSRVSTAEEWLIAEGRISKVDFSRRGTSSVAHLLFTYEVDGETHYGSAEGFPISSEKEGIAQESVESLLSLRVRYNSADPLESRLLNEDNPKMRLEINHEP
jgi:hypothetical protein